MELNKNINCSKSTTSVIEEINNEILSEDSKMNKKIAIFGGSFDPPTIAHIQCAAEVYNNCKDVDEVWIVPCGDGRKDKTLKTSGYHRLEMLKLILKDIIAEEVPIKVKIFILIIYLIIL